MNKYCDIEIKFAESQLDKVYQLGEAICGTVLIRSKLDFEIVRVGCELKGIFMPNNSTFKREESIERCILSENAILKKGECLRLDFSVKNEIIEDYKARTFDFFSEFLVVIQTKNETKSISKNKIKTSIPTKISGKGLGYEVASPAVNLEMEEPLAILGGIFFFLLFIWLQPNHSIILYMFAFVGFAILSLIGHNIYKTRFIGTVQARFKTIDDKNFEVLFFNDLNWKYASTLSAEYKVYEVDSSGEARYLKNIHNSKEIKIDQISNSKSIAFPFPVELPATTIFFEGGIYYLIICRVKSKIGFGHTYKSHFKVRRRIF